MRRFGERDSPNRRHALVLAQIEPSSPAVPTMLHRVRPLELEEIARHLRAEPAVLTANSTGTPCVPVKGTTFRLRRTMTDVSRRHCRHQHERAQDALFGVVAGDTDLIQHSRVMLHAVLDNWLPLRPPGWSGRAAGMPAPRPSTGRRRVAPLRQVPTRDGVRRMPHRTRKTSAPEASSGRRILRPAGSAPDGGDGTLQRGKVLLDHGPDGIQVYAEVPVNQAITGPRDLPPRH